VLAQASQYRFTVSQGRALLLRLKNGGIFTFTFIRDDHDALIFLNGSRLQSRLRMDTWSNLLRQSEPWSPRSTAEFLAHF